MTLSISRYFRRLGVAAVAVAAVFVQGMAAPKAISNFEELCRIGVDEGYPLDGDYELAADIDTSGSRDSNDGAGFLPIGSRKVTVPGGFDVPDQVDTSKAFTGTFDGKGHKISGLYIKRTAASEAEGFNIGLFGFTLGAEIRNVTVVADTVAGSRYVGALVGRQCGGVVEKSVALLGAVVGGADVGGLVGMVEGGGKVSVCYSSASVGGGDGGGIGGLVGSTDGAEITESYAIGKVAVSGGENVGGLVGLLKAARDKILGCYSMAMVSGGGASAVGGLVGKVDGGEVKYNYSAGVVSGAGNDVGGFIGILGNAPVTYNYWDTERSTCATSAGTDGAAPGVIGRSTAKMMDSSTAGVRNLLVGAGAAFWGISNNYPYLKNEFFPRQTLTVTAPIGGALSGVTAAGAAAHTQRVNHWITGSAVTASPSPDSIVGGFESWYIAGSNTKIDSAGQYAGFSVAEVQASGSGDMATGTLRISDLTADSVAIEARFATKVYTLRYIAVGGRGKIVSQDDNAGDSSVLADTLIKLVERGAVSYVKAEPLRGNRFLQWVWRVDGSQNISKDPARADTALGNTTFSAHFADSTIELTYDPGPNGRLRINDAAPPYNRDPYTAKPRSGENGPSVEAVPNPDYRFVMWDDSVTANPRIDSAVVESFYVTAIFESTVISVKSPDRVVPGASSTPAVAQVRPVKTITGGLTAGPNPVSRQSGKVDLYWQGAEITKGTLQVFDANGNFVGKITISGINNNSINKQHIAAWTLTDAKGKPVGAGTYLIKGTLSTKNGKREKVALILSLI